MEENTNEVKETAMVEGDQLVGVEKTNIHYLMIEAADINVAFSVFKRKLNEKDIYVDTFQNIESLIVDREHRKHDIVREFINSNKYVKENVVWGGLYANAKENSLLKKFSEKNVPQAGTKKWETRYVIIGNESGKRYDTTCTTKGDAVTKAKELVIEAKEDLSVQVEKVLISHDPTVSTIKYIKDPTAHNNIYIFMCNNIVFDEESFNSLYEENTEMDPVTKQFRIKVDTIFEYAKRIKV